MSEMRPGPAKILRAWAEALSEVADLQDAIVQTAHQLDILTLEDEEWLKPYRAIVRGALKTWPDRAKEDGSIESAQGLKRVASEHHTALLEEFRQRTGV